MVEIDVQLTRDNELVLAHDWEIGPHPRHLISVEDTDLETLREAFSSAAPDAVSAPVTLSEVLAAIPAAVALNVEIKHRRAGIDRLVTSLLEHLSDRPRVLLSSFDWTLLATLRRSRHDLPLAPIGSRRPHALLNAAESLGAATIHCHRRLAFEDFFVAARTGGWYVLVYTINDPSLARSILDRGAAGIFTDRPGAMLASLGLR